MAKIILKCHNKSIIIRKCSQTGWQSTLFPQNSVSIFQYLSRILSHYILGTFYRIKNVRTCNEYRRIKIEDKSTHSSRIRMTSVLFSKTSWSVMMLGCWISFRMFTSRSMSSLVTPRRLDLLRRFLMNLAAYSTPVLLCRHLLTTANWPLMRGGEEEIVKRCIKNSNYSFDITTLIINYS